MQQTILPLPHNPSHARADFVLSECNQHAANLLNSWPNWPAYAVILVGAHSSGKTHLATLWKQQSGAVSVEKVSDISPLRDNHILIDNADAWTDADAQTALFHLLNQTKESGRSLLLTASTPPSDWNINLPDLRSRLNSLPQVNLHAPDEALLAAVLTKHFADRQIKVDTSVIHYIVTRAERSLDATLKIAEQLDVRALQNKRPITIPLAKELFDASEEV
jgi:DnaA regulatory inactivator Hda